MASNGPYYQPVQAHDQTPVSDEMRLAQGILDYAAVAPQASMYPEPNPDYHHAQHLPDQDPQDHAQLQGLVEAATSAAAQEHIRHRFQNEEHDLASLLSDPQSTTSKRKRSTSLSNDDERPNRQKRQTLGDPLPEDHEDSPHLDARAAGVHSAAALFRAPSDSSKKYTRPPMSKLFTSLELSPENFLYLQAAAKQYMLDPDYPDRQACVGNRGRGDNEMVKARMYQCVREFLETEGWGEKYFGGNAPPADDAQDPASAQPRRYLWPRDRDRIIALCTPLLRRMVTNERQRQYAVESRKGGRQEKRSTQSNPEHDPDSVSQAAIPPEHFDPRLSPSPAYHIYLLQDDTRQLLCDRISFAMDQDLNWQVLVETLIRSWCEAIQTVQPTPEVAVDIFERFVVRVLTSSGLTSVSNESEWQLAFQDVRQTVWLEGVVKIIVDCPLQP